MVGLLITPQIRKQPMKIPYSKGAALVLAGAVTLSGCTGTTVRPSMPHQEVARTYSTVAVGEIAGSDELWHNYTVEIRRELASELIATKAFSQVLDPMPTPLPADILLVSGHITEVEKGNAAARWLVGFGAGRAHLTAEFELKDAGGTHVGTYSVRKTYAGGAGIGGAGFLDMDDLAKKLGKDAADSLAQWAKTGKFEER
jgi:Domain of unknown function (DUF4410)